MAGQILEYWRKNLKSCSDSGDIFEVINMAIFMASLDHPKEFKDHREEIVEKLYKTEIALADVHLQKQKVLINEGVASKGFDQVAKKVDEESPSSTVIDHVQKGSVSDSDHVAVSNARNKRKILPIIRMKKVKKMNSEDDWVATIVPRKMEARCSEEASKCYNGGGERQMKSSSRSVHDIPSRVLTEENKNSETKEVQTTRVGCLHEEAMVQCKLETSKRTLKDRYQAAPKRQHLIKVLDPCDMPPKSCATLDEEAMIRQKIEISKRKLKEGYQAAAKKQHLIKVLNPRDLPKSCTRVSQRYPKNCTSVSQRYHKGLAVRRCY